jgi:pyrophosphate--fructose-6-phosphate 1-phosphotransferase
MSDRISALDAARAAFLPELPGALEAGASGLAIEEGHLPRGATDAERIVELFPRTSGLPPLRLVSGPGLAAPSPVRVGVVLSGGQAPGGHNVIAGLYDGLKSLHPDSSLLGFEGGPKGVMTGRYLELTDEVVGAYRNTGGFDMIGSGRDKIESDQQQEASRATCAKLGLGGLVIIGGDDSNTNAAVLAEYFLSCGDRISVLGVPKTIDGDLKGGGVEASFGFDTATRVYSSLVGNISRDAASARKYWHFIRLMGRSASHVTLECALQTQVNLALIAEEVEERRMTLDQVVALVATQIRRRAEAGRPYGVCLVPEGLIEFIPEVRVLIAELNRLLAEHAVAFESMPQNDARRSFVAEHLTEESRGVFGSLPVRIQEQLLIDRDAHGNVLVSQIDTELLLIEQVAARIAMWREAGKYPGSFKAQGHFFGYEGRCANPTNFDANYTYGLGYVASMLTAAGRTGYICALGNLAGPPTEWEPLGVPMTSMMRMEERKGKPVPVIAKALVRTDSEPFLSFARLRDGWAVEDAFLFPGAIQYFGPHSVKSQPTKTLLLERTGSTDPPAWLRCEDR